MIEDQNRRANLPAPGENQTNEKLNEHVSKCCRILGVVQDEITVESVKAAWKKQLVAKRDEIGTSSNHDLVAELNNAKDTLLGWLKNR